MEQIGNLLSKVMAKRGLGVQAHASYVVHTSQQWLHEKLPALRTFLRVEKFQDGTIYVTCTHSIAAQECYPLFADLQAYLLKECRFKDIEGVRLTRS